MTQLYHHQFAPWRVQDSTRVLASPATKLGPKLAGRLLDGREHVQTPVIQGDSRCQK